MQPLVDGLPPFVGQRGKHAEPVVAGRLQGQACVLERQRQRELGREVAPGDPLQLGCLPRRHQRTAIQGIHSRSDSTPPARSTIRCASASAGTEASSAAKATEHTARLYGHVHSLREVDAATAAAAAAPGVARVESYLTVLP
jgi:hypothetical protein